MARWFVLGCWMMGGGLAQADNWTHWRGPHGNGSAEGQGYVTEWSPTQHRLWSLPLPGRGASTPAVWEDAIFLSYVADDLNVAACVTRAGALQWTRELGSARLGKHKKATGANSSPTTDGEHVYFYFKSGDLACLDLAGRLVWQVNLQKRYLEDTLWWDLGTSPLLLGEAIIVACVQAGPSYVVAFDKRTGEELWKQDRQFPAPEEANQSYSSPIPLENGEAQFVVLGADHLTAHRLADGGEVWRLGGLNPTQHKFFRSIASPVVWRDLVITPYARGESLTAVRSGGQGDITDSHMTWQIDGPSCDVPTPAVAGDRLYLSLDQHDAACLNAETGEVIWRETLERNRTTFSASPVVADGKVYFTREDGVTFVTSASDQFQLLAKNELRRDGEPTVATPVFLDGRIYLRSEEALHCISDE